MMRLAERSFFCHTACIPVVAKKFSSFSNLWWVKSATELFTNPHWVAKMGRWRLFCCKAASWLHVEKAPFPNKMSPKMPSPFPKEIYGLLNWGVINHWPHDPFLGPLFLGHPRVGPDELKLHRKDAQRKMRNCGRLRFVHGKAAGWRMGG